MTDLSITRKDGRWAVILDGTDVTSELTEFTVESNPDAPYGPATVHLKFKPRQVDLSFDEAEIVEVPHEHEWLSLRTVEDTANREDPQVCRCGAKRIVREQFDTPSVTVHVEGDLSKADLDTITAAAKSARRGGDR
mgnify:CR=1 FL=1